MNIVLAVLILGGIILFHELGHFIFAKLSGIEVTEFSDMFPNKGTKKYYRTYVEVRKSNVKENQ